MSSGSRQRRAGTKRVPANGHTPNPEARDLEIDAIDEVQDVQDLPEISYAPDGTSHPLANTWPADGQTAGDGLDDTGPMNIPLVAGVPVAQPERRSPEEVVRQRYVRRRTLLTASSILLVLVLLVESIILSPWTDPAAGQPPRQPSTIPLSEVDPYGVNVFLHKEVDEWKKQKTLDMASAMGAAWIKQQFPWAEIEFSRGNYYDAKNNQSAWTKFDDIVDLAQQRGLRIIARIDSTPEWARADDSMPAAVQSDLRNNPKVPPSAGHLQDFADFVRTFVEHYKGRIPVLQIWNEPNLQAEWGTGINAEGYVQLLSSAYIAAKSVDPNIIVLAAPLAPTITRAGQIVNGNINEMDYMQAMYYAAKQLGIAPPFDAMAANAYGKGYPPEDPPSPDKLNFRRVELLRDVMDRNGDRNKAIWFNEYGWNASPDNLPTPTAQGQVTYPWDKVTPEQQADYTVRGIEYAKQHWPWAGVFTIWYLREVGDVPQTSSEYYFSLVNPEFVPNPVYSAVQQAAKNTQEVATPGEWGPLSAPILAGPLWEIRLSPAASGGVYVAPARATIQGQNAINFTFQGTDVSLKLVPPAQPVTGTLASARYYVTVDGSSKQVDSKLPVDSSGRPYIDLSGSSQATEVTLVSGLGRELPTGKHNLTISVEPTQIGQVQAGHVAVPDQQTQEVNLPGIAAIEVQSNRSYILFGVITLLLVVGLVLVLLALRRSQGPVESVAGER